MKPKIETGIPAPIGRESSTMSELRNALLLMKPGDSFVWPDANFPYRAASEIGVKVISRKLKEGGWRFWKMGQKKDFPKHFTISRRLDFDPKTFVRACEVQRDYWG